MPLDLYHLESCPYCRKVREYIAAPMSESSRIIAWLGENEERVRH
jgi:glutaredoxin